MGNGGLACDDRSADVDVQERVDVLQRDVLDLRQSENPRIVDKDVEAAQRGDCLLDRSLDGGGIRAVGLDRDGATAQRLDGVDNLGGSLRRLLVGDSYSAPSAASAFAIAAPIPRLAPVTRARFPVSVMASSFCVERHRSHYAD
jgi:hypothetical protein